LDIDDQQVARLNHMVQTFYEWLGTYVLDLLDKYRPSVLGLSVYKGSLPASLFAFKLTREKYTTIKTVMGGAVFSQTLGYGTPNFERFLKKTKDYLDYIIIGEGELLFLKLLEGELPAGQRVYTLADVGNETLDLSKMEIPDFSDLNIRFYPNLSAYSSRSCPFNCSFCTETVYWGQFRKKKAKQVIEELSELYKRHNFRLFLLCDSLINPIVMDLARESINSDISIYWDGYLRVESRVCDPDTTFLWRQGGFYRARLGVESGSQQILDAMKKNITIDKIKSAISSLADSGIKTTTYWIIGYPGETEEDFQKTLDLIEELKDNIYEAECNPFGYYLSGQVDSGEWLAKFNRLPLYPEEIAESLITQSWILDCEPSREETYQRISRFVEHCRRLGIANPYSLYDIYQADARWKKLHKHAVPSIIEFKNRDNDVDESKHLKRLSLISATLDDEQGFDF